MTAEAVDYRTIFLGDRPAGETTNGRRDDAGQCDEGSGKDARAKPRRTTAPQSCRPARTGGSGARFLILDPVVAHLHGALDSHKDQQVRQALAPLARWADAANGAVLGVMHLNKGLGADVLNRVNGSRGFTAAARSVLTVGDDPQNPEQRVVAVGKANLAPTDMAALRFRIEGRSVPHPDEEEPISTSGIVWMGEAIGVNSRDILAIPTDEDERPARKEAAAWLADLLGIEPVASKTVKAEAEKAGLAWRTVRRAKDEIGVEARRWGRPGEAGGWCWSLASAAEGVHETSKVSTLIGGTRSESGGHLQDDDAHLTDIHATAEAPAGEAR